MIKRVKNTERDVACLLSGGLDSSLVAALVKRHYKGDLHTWSIGMEGSEDLKYAKQVADHIGSIHHSVVVSEEEVFIINSAIIKIMAPLSYNKQQQQQTTTTTRKKEIIKNIL